MNGILKYSEELRTIGQALQVRGVTAFDLHRVKAGYFIKDLGERRPSLRNWLRRQFRKDSDAVTYGFELSEIEELSRAGRARRASAGRLTDFRDLSNVLRTIGAYVDAKHGELIELQKNPISVSLAYRDAAGNEQREDRPVSSFYNVFREIVMKRAPTSSTGPRQS